MKDVYELVDTAINQCLNVGITPGAIVEITINRRAANRWGRTTRLSGGRGYRIEISSELLDDAVSYKATMDTVMHEVLHTCKDCMNHGKIWKYYANIVNHKYGYDIKRTTSYEEKGLSMNSSKVQYKYIVTCTNCGAVNRYQREGKVVQYIKKYGSRACTCGRCGHSSFKVEEL